MDERVQFISDYRRQLFTMTELCERYGVSRKTGYALIERYAREGIAGLVPRTSRLQQLLGDVELAEQARVEYE